MSPDTYASLYVASTRTGRWYVRCASEPYRLFRDPAESPPSPSRSLCAVLLVKNLP